MTEAIVGLVKFLLGKFVRTFLDDLFRSRQERRAEAAEIRREQRRRRDENLRENVELVEASLPVVSDLVDGRYPFRYGADDPLGTSGEEYFQAQVNGLADFDEAKGVRIKVAMEVRRFGDALRELREWRRTLG